MPSIHWRRQLNMGSTTNNLLFTCLCGYLGAVSFGFVIGYSSPALPLMQKEGLLDSTSASWFGSIMNIGGILGCPLAGWLVDKIGRKSTLLVSGLPFLCGSVLVFLVTDEHLLCLGRLISGVGAGMSLVICPLYIAEMAPKEVRGMLGSGVQLSITIGIFVAYLVGGMISWKNLAALGALIPLIAGLITLKAPDTPRYIMSKGKNSEATHVLKWLRPPGTDLSEEIQNMEDTASEEKIPISQLVKHSELFRPLTISVGLMVLQQLSGINVVMFFTVSIFQMAGYENGNAASVGVAIVQVVMTVVACILMDRAGRRMLLTVSGLGMGISCLSLAFYYHHKGANLTSDLNWLALASLVSYIIFFSIGWGPIPMLIMSEIFPSKARGAASAVVTFCSWSSSFIITKQFVLMQSILGMHGSFLLFGICCLGSVLFVFKQVPETKGRSLEEIESLFTQQSTKAKLGSFI